MSGNDYPSIEKWEKWDVSEIVSDLMGKSFKCPECGNVHSMTTKKLELEENITDKMGDKIEAMGLSGKCLVIFDKNTYGVAGERLLKALARFNPEHYIFTRDDLHADSQAIGRVLIAMSKSPDFLVSCGSGCITDTTRYVSYMTKLPFVAFGTAASMDGYASSSTPLIVDGFKVTYPGKAPQGVFADTLVLAGAPRAMTAAGFGDVLAKTVAIIDWKLAHDCDGETYCPLISGLVTKAVRECVSLSGEIASGDPAACGKLMQVLSLTGITMQMMGMTRPASGAEHQISHLLEMRDITAGKKGSLHGDKVGIGTLISLYIYDRMFCDGMPEQRDTMPAGQWEQEVRRVYGPLAGEAIRRNDPTPPSGKEWEDQKKRIKKAMEEYGFEFVKTIPVILSQYKSMIEKIGGPVRPDQLGYSVQETYDAIAFSKEVRYKFTILRIAERYGWLYDLAREISEGLPTGMIY
ncbi:MAG: sn-glycerol-1-phosphate dehydrogenase [Saccharofermentanales bacterium]